MLATVRLLPSTVMMRWPYDLQQPTLGLGLGCVGLTICSSQRSGHDRIEVSMSTSRRIIMGKRFLIPLEDKYTTLLKALVV